MRAAHSHSIRGGSEAALLSKALTYLADSRAGRLPLLARRGGASRKGAPGVVGQSQKRISLFEPGQHHPVCAQRNGSFAPLSERASTPPQLRRGNRSPILSAKYVIALSEEGWREAPGWFPSEPCKNAALEPPPARSRLRRDRAALLTKEGIFETSLQVSPPPNRPCVYLHGPDI